MARRTSTRNSSEKSHGRSSGKSAGTSVGKAAGKSAGKSVGKSRGSSSVHADDGDTEGQTTLSEFEAGKLYYRIGEVAELTGVKPYVLRYWETEFKWMAPQKSRSKQRLYRPKDIEMVFLIKTLLYEERFTIAGARKRLKELGVDQVKAEAEPPPPPGPTPVAIRKELMKMRKELVVIRDLM